MTRLIGKSFGPLEELGPTIPLNSSGTPGPVTCEICGAQFEDLEETSADLYHTATFLGKVVVLDCCGRIFNEAYRELGRAFAEAKLIEFSENPTGNPMLLSHIKDCMIEANKKLVETGLDVAQIIQESKKILPQQ